MASQLNSLEILKRDGIERASHGHVPDPLDFQNHVQFYRSFLGIGALFVAHAAVLLAGLAYFLV